MVVLFSNNFLGITLVLIFLLSYYFFVWYNSKLQYWKRKKFPYILSLDSIHEFTSYFKSDKNLNIDIANLHLVMKRLGWKLGGFYHFTKPICLVTDLEYIKNILAKDFHHFNDRGIYHHPNSFLQDHLFNLSGEKWRSLRTLLTPTFSSAKIKLMFGSIYNCVPNLIDSIESQAVRKQPINIKEVLSCFTINVIGSCAFGLDLKLFESENSPFRIYGKRALHRSKFNRIKRLLAEDYPNFAKWLNIENIAAEQKHFFLNLIRETVESKEKNQSCRKDLLQLLIDTKNGNDRLTLEEITAECYVFFLAGYETSNTAMTFALYELCKNQKIQDEAREEICRVLEKTNNEITYEAIQEMKYLSQIVDEALRKYPPLAFLQRQCVQEYKLPNSDLIIDEKTKIFISIMGLHYDKEYYPDPEKFDPERFAPENVAKRPSYTYLPFGSGPKNCIGLRFGLLETRLGIACLLKNFKFTVHPKTLNSLVFAEDATVLEAKGAIWLSAQKI